MKGFLKEELNSGYGYGYGYGSGDGYGYGDGSGSGDGYGYGDGYGSGDGDGDGSGSGYGYGYGYGYGDGSGSGYGSGYGYGDGDSYGSGDGDGYGDGDGSGSGDGYGSGQLQDNYLNAILGGHAHKARGCVIAFWRSNADGSPANGGDNRQRKLGEIEEIVGPLKLCTANALHATLKPQKWKGSRWWIVALHEPVARGDDKLGSLKRTIVADLGKYPFDDN